MQRIKLRHALIAIVGLLLVVTLAVHAQYPEPSPTPVPAPNQHWKIIPHISPDGLQAELEKLNREGYVVTNSNWELVDNTFVLHVSDVDLRSNQDDNCDE